MRPDVAIVVGHRRSAQGARAVDGQTEWAWNCGHASLLAAACRRVGVSAVLVLRDDRPSGYRSLPAKVNATRARCAVELHFNSSASRRASGSVVLHFVGSTGGQALARELAQADDVLGLRDRGLGGTRGLGWSVNLGRKLVLPGPMALRAAQSRASSLGDGYRAARQNGAWFVEKTAMPAVVVEPAFGSNQADWSQVLERQGDLAGAQALGLLRWVEARKELVA